jgi:hypothetical protein
MIDESLLIFGCAVSFIAVAGAYVYIRECFSRNERGTDRGDEAEQVARPGLRDIA